MALSLGLSLVAGKVALRLGVPDLGSDLFAALDRSESTFRLPDGVRAIGGTLTPEGRG